MKITVDAFQGKVFEGRITAIDSQVDPVTHTLRAQATINNDGLQLRPGMYATVEAELPKMIGVIVVPRTAITYSLYGDSVFVLRAEAAADGSQVLKAVRTPVKLGLEHDREVVVTSGLQAGDQVVSAGQLKLQDGMAVKVSEAAAAAAPAAE